MPDVKLSIADPDLHFPGCLLDAGYIPVVSPLTADDQGAILNINADTIAATLARVRAAVKVPLATGERYYTRWGVWPLLRDNAGKQRDARLTFSGERWSIAIDDGAPSSWRPP